MLPRETTGTTDTLTDIPPAANADAAASVLALLVPAGAALGAGAGIAYKYCRKGGKRSRLKDPDRVEMVQCQQQEQDYAGDLDAAGQPPEDAGKLPATDQDVGELLVAGEDAGELPADGQEAGRELSPVSTAALTESRSGSQAPLQPQQPEDIPGE